VRGLVLTMFSVPGWSVRTTVATQTTNGNGNDAKQKKSKDKPKADSTEGSGQSLKRKFGKVDAGNVEEVWGQVFEGKEKVKEKVKEKEKEKPKKAKKGKDDSKRPVIAKEAVNQQRPKDPKEKNGPPKSKSSDIAKPKAIESNGDNQRLTPLQASMRAKLSSARFRHLNEQLYTKPSGTALSLFAETPSLFEEYHTGFRQQVAIWPENPVDSYISEIHERATVQPPKSVHPHRQQQQQQQAGPKPLPRLHGTCTIADLGCGDARLAQELKPQSKKLHVKIHSFDLHSPSPFVTAADISSLPLPSGSVDVSIFCLALMGTNWPDFIDEAYRILRWQGELWIAEIKSRFVRPGTNTKSAGKGPQPKFARKIGEVKNQKPVTKEEIEGEQNELLATAVDGAPGKAETDIGEFVAVLEKHGFLLDGGNEATAVDLSNKMFVKMRFVKGIKPKRGKNVDHAKAHEDARNAGFRDKFKKKKKGKFLEDVDNDDVPAEEEGKILKPCVYKLR
jgi:ribosomal RNA-processing protein 8